jgi:predicted AlkP superfamily pyrophosphatase or phosphodiesterase
MKIAKRVFPIFLSLFLLLNIYPVGISQQRSSQPITTKPRLVLFIAIDQFRYDYLERFNDLYSDNGLRRLMRDGASWVNGNYDHYPTYTAPGHATMMTGAFPSQTGIVGNEWPDRETGKRVSSVTDRSVKILGGVETAVGVSPARLMASTVGDELRLVTVDRSKVIGISVKDRSAILPAGRHANAAYWLSTASGTMVSSTYYFPQLPAWVTTFNNSRPLDKYFGAKWDRLLPESVYLQRAGVDSPEWETVPESTNDTNKFPHVITGGAKAPSQQFYSALDFSPFTNEVLVSFAEQAIINEKLGQDDDTDVLTVSFSSNDYIGHRYGPYSQEAMDAALRVDRAIASLLDIVQSRIGLDKTIVALTADHGVSPIPEHAAALGLGAARVNVADVMKIIRAAISKRYNPTNKTPDPTLDYIYKDEAFGQVRDAVVNGNIYFNYEALARDGVNQNELQQVVAQAALSVKGIARCYTRSQLMTNSTMSDSLASRVVHGFYPNRSGDVVMVPEPYVYVGEPIRATHGSPYTYDTHVPVMIMGRGVTAGRYLEEASPADIAPTLAVLLGIQQPTSVTGRVLREALVLKSVP